MKLAPPVKKIGLEATKSVTFVTAAAITGLLAISFPASAQWVFKTGETMTSPRNASVNRPRSNQSTNSRPSIVDMSQETMPVQNTTRPRANQERSNSNRDYSNQDYANQRTAQYDSSRDQQAYQQQNNASPAPRVNIKNDSDSSNVRFLLSSWAGDGELEWTHNARASEPAFGDPTSRLNYSGASSKIIDLGVAVDIANGFYAEVHYGGGEIDSGTLIDDDYLSADGAGLYGVTSTSDILFSRTESPISEQDVSYYELKFGRRLNTASIPGLTLDAFAKYQYWKERYDAFGVTQITCIAPGVLCNTEGESSFEDTNVITNTSQWQSLFLGLQGTFEILPGLNLKGSVAYSPRSQVTNNDIHQLRSDLRYDPSISIQSTGSGYNYEVELNYNFWRNWSAFVGYRAWELSTNNDDNAVEFFDESGVSGFGTKLNNIQIKRDGITAGIGYNFKSKSL